MKAEVKPVRGLPTLLIDDIPQVPMFFFANTEIGRNDVCEKEIKLVADAGIHLYSVSCHLPVWLPENERSYDNALESLRLTLRNDPAARILLRVNISVYGHLAEIWDEKYPGDAMLFAYGTTYDNDVTNANSGGTAVTLASDDWVREACSALRGLDQAIQKYPELEQALLGYHIAAGETGEWFHCSLRERGVDLSETNREKYCSWLADKYSEPSALCKAWDLPSDSVISFDDIQIPVEIEGNNRSIPASRTLFTRAGDQRFIDYSDYSSDIVADRILFFAQYTKELTKREKIVVFFYGYHFDLYDARTGHFRVDRILQSPDIDAFSSPICYTDRNEGGVGALMGPADTFVRAGKLWLVENDLRTCLCLRDEGGYDWVPRISSLENLFEVYRREFAQMVNHGLGCWYMDLLARGWQYHPVVWENIAGLTSRYEAIAKSNMPFQPDVAVLVDEYAMSVCAHAEAAGMNLLYSQRLQLYRSGFRFGLYTAQDYESNGHGAKLVIYLDPFSFNEERAKQVTLKYSEEDSSVLFMHGFGRTPVELVKLLTGIEMDIYDTRMTELTSSSCEGFLNAGEMITPDTMTDGARPAAKQKADPVSIPLENSGICVLARFSEGVLTNRASVVLRKINETRFIAFASPLCISSNALREIASLAGVHIYSQSNDTCLAGNNSVTLHTRSGGPKEIQFTVKGDWKEIYSNRTYCDSDCVQFDAASFKTYTFINN